MNNTDIYKYAYNLIKRKNYFIKELYDKLIVKYDKNEVYKVIKEFINNDFINDKILVNLKINYFINERKYGVNYIYNYFNKYNISHNLIKYTLNKYDSNIFEINKKSIIDELIIKGKDEIYINNYLSRKGYDIE